MRSLSKHIMYNLLIILIPLILVISAVSYYRFDANIKSSMDMQEDNSIETIKESIKMIENRNEILGDMYAEEMEKNSDIFLESYNETILNSDNGTESNITDMNLASLNDELEWGIHVDRADLYIINRTGVIVNTTYEDDLGLDFKEANPQFYNNKLKPIFEEGDFVAEPVTGETTTGKLRIYSYMPTPDGKYILEIGLFSEEIEEMVGSAGYLDTAETLEEMNPYIKDIRIFDGLGNLLGNPERNISEDTISTVKEVHDTESNKTIHEDDQNERIRYIPVYISRNPENPHRVVELTFDEGLKSERLRQNALIHLLVGSLSIFIIAAAVPYISKRLSKPINEMVTDIEDIGKGNRDKIEKEPDIDELNALKETTNKMVKKLKRSLKEKDLLLDEINHRVKNNMQIISSMLTLQESKEKDEERSKLLQEAQSRLQSMAMIHESLYESEDMTQIDLGDYIEKLVTNIYRTSDLSHEETELETDLEEIKLGIAQANPCALVVNELVTNAIWHAFPDNHDGEKKLRVTTSSVNERTIEIIVSDTGVGIPDEIDIDDPESFGLHIVNILVKDQLDGEIEVERDGGTTFRIRFEK